MSNADELLNRPEVKLRRFEGLLVQLHEARGKVKAYSHAMDVIVAALDRGAGVNEVRQEVNAGMIGVLQEAQQISEALERIVPGITQRLLDDSDDED